MRPRRPEIVPSERLVSLNRNAPFHKRKRERAVGDSLAYPAELWVPNSIDRMLNVHVERETTAAPELVLDTLRDQSPERRGEIWSNITPKRFTLHESGPDFLDVTEGTFIVGVFWERNRYEWSVPGCVISTVSESNVFKPGSKIELRAAPREEGGSRVEMIVRREYQRGPKGRIAAAVNHLGGRRLFGWYLGTALTALEKRIAAEP